MQASKRKPPTSSASPPHKRILHLSLSPALDQDVAASPAAASQSPIENEELENADENGSDNDDPASPSGSESSGSEFNVDILTQPARHERYRSGSDDSDSSRDSKGGTLDEATDDIPLGPSEVEEWLQDRFTHQDKLDRIFTIDRQTLTLSPALESEDLKLETEVHLDYFCIEGALVYSFTYWN